MPIYYKCLTIRITIVIEVNVIAKNVLKPDTVNVNVNVNLAESHVNLSVKKGFKLVKIVTVINVQKNGIMIVVKQIVAKVITIMKMNVKKGKLL
jgi:hypothetical protein